LTTRKESQRSAKLKDAGATIKFRRNLREAQKQADERAARNEPNFLHGDEQLRLLREAQRAANEPKLPDPGEVLEQHKLLKEGMAKFESKVIKEIRSMLDGHKLNNTYLYLAVLQSRKKRLLREKLRRLRQAQQNQEQSNV
jgi:hypothetical protein